jgi:hypothetical protein
MEGDGEELKRTGRRGFELDVVVAGTAADEPHAAPGVVTRAELRLADIEMDEVRFVPGPGQQLKPSAGA